MQYNNRKEIAGNNETKNTVFSTVMNLLLIFILIIVSSFTDRDSSVIDIGSRLELFVDDYLIDHMENARLVLHRPQPREVSLICEEPWEIGGPGYATVFKDGDIYRMYYYGIPDGKDETMVTCYAESDDGINWHKPELGLHEFEGSKKNNIILRGPASHNFSPFKDNNPNTLPDQQYKGIGCGGFKQPMLRFASPDGINWRRLDELLRVEGNFDSHNTVFWDSEQGVYRAYWRASRRNDPRVPDGRDIKTATSDDFLNWSEQLWLDYKPNRSGSYELDMTDDRGDHHQFYTNNVQAYYRAPHLLFGFPVRYSDRGWTPSKDVLPNLEERRELADRGIGGGRPTRLGTALTDVLFMASRNGQAFYVWPEAFIRPGIQRPGSWFYWQSATAWGMVETPPLFVGGPPELSFYVTDNARVGGPSRLRRYTLRIDGFASVYAPLTGGTVVTRLISFEGEYLEINFSSSAGGRLRIELQDECGNPIQGFALEDCDLQYGDQIDRVVTWNGKAEVSELAGRAVRLHFELKDADVFAFRFR